MKFQFSINLRSLQITVLLVLFVFALTGVFGAWR